MRNALTGIALGSLLIMGACASPFQEAGADNLMSRARAGDHDAACQLKDMQARGEIPLGVNWVRLAEAADHLGPEYIPSRVVSDREGTFT